MVFWNIPVGYQAAVAGLRQIDRSLDEAATSLGASKLRGFRDVLVPMLGGSLRVGFVTTFVRAVTTLSVVIFLFTPATTVATIRIYQLVNDLNWGGATAFTVADIGMAIVALVIFAAPRADASPWERPVPETAHLRVSHVTKRFGGVTAVDDVSFDVPKGAFATLLGPSGCGKTTTLRMIAGFYDPDVGDIEIDGRRVNELPAHRRGTAMVFQDYALFPHMTVSDNVAYGLRVAHASRADRERRVTETLAFVGLTGLRDRWPSQLSGGQQQRVAVARALVIEPQVLLLEDRK